VTLKKLVSHSIQFLIFFIGSLYLAGLAMILFRTVQRGSLILTSDTFMTLEIYILSLTSIGLAILTSKAFYHMIIEYRLILLDSKVNRIDDF